MHWISTEKFRSIWGDGHHSAGQTAWIKEDKIFAQDFLGSIITNDGPGQQQNDTASAVSFSSRCIVHL